ASQAGAPSRKLLSSGLSAALPEVAARMGVEAGADVLTRRRLMSIDGVPVRLAVSYFLPEASEAAELSGGTFLQGGLQQLFDRHGRRFGRAEETLVARIPATEEAQLLQIDSADPVVELLRTSYDDAGRAVHTLQTICAASRHIFVVRQMPGDAVF
ncbi:MAG TPA: UTRA domain-containing protein, partial [Actinomycetota bacterium]|nr:UTRA domain-containing protein [Actinomycetota bacterium]